METYAFFIDTMISVCILTLIVVMGGIYYRKRSGHLLEKIEDGHDTINYSTIISNLYEHDTLWKDKTHTLTLQSKTIAAIKLELTKACGDTDKQELKRVQVAAENRAKRNKDIHQVSHFMFFFILGAIGLKDVLKRSLPEMSQNQETSVLAIIATVIIMFTFYLFIVGVGFKYLRLFLKQGNNQTKHAAIMLAIHELLESERSLPSRSYRSSPFHTRMPHRNHSNRR